MLDSVQESEVILVLRLLNGVVVFDLFHLCICQFAFLEQLDPLTLPVLFGLLFLFLLYLVLSPQLLEPGLEVDDVVLRVVG